MWQANNISTKSRMVSVDVMVNNGDKFYGNVKFKNPYPFGNIWKAMEEAVLQKFPTLKGRNDIIVYLD